MLSLRGPANAHVAPLGGNVRKLRLNRRPSSLAPMLPFFLEEARDDRPGKSGAHARLRAELDLGP